MRRFIQSQEVKYRFPDIEGYKMSDTDESMYCNGSDMTEEFRSIQRDSDDVYKHGSAHELEKQFSKILLNPKKQKK